jgi:hypothetical protein
VTALVKQKENGVVPLRAYQPDSPDGVRRTALSAAREATESFQFSVALTALAGLFARLNKTINDERPWESADDRRQRTLATCAVDLARGVFLLSAYTPGLAEEAARRLGCGDWFRLGPKIFDDDAVTRESDRPWAVTTGEPLVKKIEALKQSGDVDLSTEEDLSIAVMNLVSLEEHFFFTGEKTKNDSYFDLLGEVRSVRKALLGRLINAHEGETWCVSKHLLAATMRLIEVGTKLRADGKKAQAQETFDYGYKLYSLFWALRLKLIDTKGLQKAAEEDKPWKLEDIVNKLVNCCDE